MAEISTDQSKNVNWRVREKTDNTLTINVTLAAVAYDISPFTFIADIFLVGSSTPFLSLTQGSGITNGGATGILTLSLTDTQLTISPDQYFWKLRTTSPTDTIWLNGQFIVNGYIWDGSTSSSLSIAISLGDNTLSLALTLGGAGGSGDVVGPASSVDSEVALFSGITGKLLKSGGGVKDGTGGVAGLTLFKINFKNAANSIISFFTNANTVARTYLFQDRDGTIADTYVNHPAGSTNDRYHESALSVAATLTTALTINVIRVIQFEVKYPTTIDGLAAEITTGTTGNVRFCIYAPNATGYPGALIYDSGTITVTAPAVKNPTISLVLKPGMYWKGYITDTANTFRAIGNATLYSGIGFPSTLGNNTCGVCYSTALAFGAFTDPFPAGASVITIATLNVFPIIALRDTPL
jgi:hypothetical protein